MADPRTPLLSLIVPVYNVEDYIADCLDSILDAPGFTEHCELVIVDDGSPDGSMAIVEQRCAGLANVTIVRQANAGLGAARNAGLAHASGRYVWFIDSDDEIGRDAIGVLTICMDRLTPDVVAFEFETMGGTLKRGSYLEVYDHPVDPVDFLTSGRPPSPVQFYAYSRALLHRANLAFHPGIYHEDALFTALALTRATTLVRLRHPCYRYRLRSGSIMSLSRPDKHLADMLHIAALLATEARTHPPDSRIRRALGREVGFALGAVRYYAVRTASDRRRHLMSLAQLLALGREWWISFPPRVLANYARLLAFVTLKDGIRG